MAHPDGHGTFAPGYDVMLLTDRRLIFFGGKGGVGKTTMASAVGLALAKHGRRVLIVSTDPAHSLGHLWEQRIGNAVTYLHKDLLAGLELDPEHAAQRHFADVASTVRSMMPEHLHGEVERYFRHAIDSPGAHEAALLERIAELSLDSSDTWDTIIFDTAPTGHTIRLLEMPQLLTVWAEGMMGRAKKTAQFHAAMEALPGDTQFSEPSPVAERNAKIRAILERRGQLFRTFYAALTSKKTTGFVIVTLAERMPVAETLELKEQLKDAKIPIAGVIVNRRSPSDAGKLLALRRQNEDDHLSTLTKSMQKIPVVQVDLQEREPTGFQALEAFSEQLSAYLQ